MFTIPILIFGLLLTTGTIINKNSGSEHEENLKKSVIRLRIPSGGWGTGFAVRYKKKNVIITNAHICENNKHLYSYKGKARYKLKIIKISKRHDLCMVEGIKYLQPLKISEKAHKNELIHTMGYPLSRYQIFTSGKLKGFDRSILEYDLSLDKCIGRIYLRIEIIENVLLGERSICMMDAKFYFTTLQIDSGASGSPVINDDGEVVGVISLSSGNISFGMAVPHYEIKAFLKE